MLPFWIALQFLTVIPIQLSRIPNQTENARSVLFYPLIGLMIGLILYAFALYTTNFTEPLSYQDSAFLKLPKFP